MTKTNLRVMGLGVWMLSACGDDSDPEQTGTTGDSATVNPETSAASDPTTDTADESSTSGPPGTSTTDDPTASESSGATADSSTGDTEGEGATYIALIRGEMADPDLEASQVVHDMIAGGAMGPSMAAGDFGHDALLGTTLLGTTENEFLALDRWNNLAGAQATYSDPAFLRAFGGFFAAPPALDLFERQVDWAEYGDFDITDDDPDHYFVIVRGRIPAPGGEVDAHALHDQIVGGSMEQAMAAGDLAHLVYLGVEDPQEYFALDIWGDAANMEAFYGNPEFQAAVGMLFVEPPSLAVYRSTDWLQW